MKINLLLILELLIVLGLPFIILKITKEKKYAIVYWCIFLAIAAYLYKPTSGVDLYRHKIWYTDIAKIPIKNYLFSQPKSFIFYFYNILGNIGISFQMFVFIFTFSIHFILLKMIIIVLKKNKIKKFKFKLEFLIVYLMIIDYRVLLLGVRNSIAIPLMVYGIFKMFYKKENKGIIYCIVSLFFHPQMGPYLLLIILTKIINKTSKCRFIFKFSFVGILLTSNKIMLLSILLGQYGNSFKRYLLNSKNLILTTTDIYYYLVLAPFICSITYLMVINKKSKLRNITYMCAVIPIFFSRTFIFLERYSRVVIFLTFFIFIDEFKLLNKREQITFKILFFFSGLILVSANIIVEKTHIMKILFEI